MAGQTKSISHKKGQFSRDEQLRGKGLSEEGKSIYKESETKLVENN